MYGRIFTIPDAFLISAVSADLPILVRDCALPSLLADHPLLLLGVPPEEGPAGVAGHSPVVDTALWHRLAADRAFKNAQRHFVFILKSKV